ncbi:CopG family transcriptional regulator [Thiobacillus sp. 0-1251]|uniref:ribbon-helix-helix domain-containing protein n=1 Tax=Thiobacillus sp. 0-1251 TaxID=1895858 RepID=UPI00095BB627|nr:CopG family transcriptional regulator [Thiobacillus sp. 0-1251]MBN8762156.1 CopG family transcriptional regulator [Thiobacillus sp.]OJY58196.1 MAG: transcriptional regulator [Thiobacillus sp. 0-1251]
MATVRAQLILSDELDREINKAAEETGNSRSELVRKALTLYLAALDKKKQGLKLGFAKPEQTLETEVIGL